MGPGRQRPRWGLENECLGTAWSRVVAAPVLLGLLVSHVVKDEKVNNLMKATSNGAFTGKIGGGKISVIRRKEVMGIEPGHTGQEAP